MERVQTECRKCGNVFSTTAVTRTTCPHCKGAVSVRRDRADPYEDEEYEGTAGNPWVTGITALVGLAFVIFGIFKGRGTDGDADD